MYYQARQGTVDMKKNLRMGICWGNMNEEYMEWMYKRWDCPLRWKTFIIGLIIFIDLTDIFLPSK